MKRTHLKLKLKRTGDHIHCSVFMGPEGETLANCGELTFRIGEWQLFGALLSLGYDSPSSIRTHCLFTVEGEEKALGR